MSDYQQLALIHINKSTPVALAKMLVITYQLFKGLFPAKQGNGQNEQCPLIADNPRFYRSNRA